MFRESEFDVAARELEYQLSLVAPRIQRRVYRRPHRDFELEFEAFDPTPPAPGTIIISGFAPNSPLLGRIQRAAVDRFAKRILAEMPTKPKAGEVVLRFEGHEDETGDPASFRKLSKERALAVLDHFKDRLEIHLSKMSGSGTRIIHPEISCIGPNRPIRSNVTAAGRAQNRRVEIHVTWHPGPPTGGSPLSVCP